MTWSKGTPYLDRGWCRAELAPRSHAGAGGGAAEKSGHVIQGLYMVSRPIYRYSLLVSLL